jgi:hypothetical protein
MINGVQICPKQHKNCECRQRYQFRELLLRLVFTLKRVNLFTAQ